MSNCTKTCYRNLRSGNNTIGHCAACHKDFAGIKAFDRHFSRNDDGRPVCRDLSEIEGWVDDVGVFHLGEQLTRTRIQEIWG